MPRDKESINHSARFVERKSRYITRLVVFLDGSDVEVGEMRVGTLRDAYKNRCARNSSHLWSYKTDVLVRETFI